MSELAGLDEVEEELLRLIQHFNDAMDIMETFEDETRPVLVETAKNILVSFRRIHDLEPKISGTVPFELIEEIDKGNNPDDYSRKILEEAEQNEKRAGEKHRWMKTYRDSLYSNVSRLLPDLEA
jgi:hypothetical protein